MNAQVMTVRAMIGAVDRTTVLETALTDILADIRHWQADAACKLAPTPESLAAAEARILAVIGDPSPRPV